MPAKSAIFLDANAGLPLHPRACEALRDLLTEESGGFPFNPSSPHSLGQKSRRMLEAAHLQVLHSLLSEKARARVSSGDAGAVFFTGSGTEANQWVVRSVLETPGGSHHWVTTAGEHDSILQMIPWARARGITVTVLPLLSDGQPCWETFRRACADATPPTLVSFLLVNNETGVVLGKPDIGVWISESARVGAAIHLDAAQAWGKMPLELDQLGADFVTFSGHKIGGLAGSGLVWLAPARLRGAHAAPGRLILGKAEQGRRGGTQSVLNAFVLGIAASCLQESLGTEKTSQIRKLTADFEKALQARLGERITLNGTDSPRVPGTTHISLSGISGEGLIAALDLEGFAVSSGSACSSGTLEPSHVLLAMGISPELARASLRVSLPRHLPIAELEMALRSFVDALERVHARMSRVPVRVASKPSQPGQHI